MNDLSEIMWKEFFLNDIFSIVSTSSGIDRNKLSNDTGEFPYITRGNRNNGYDCFVGRQRGNYSFNEGNVITIGLDTQTVHYQPYRFYTGQNIQILSNDSINKYSALFLVPLLRKVVEKFNWGSSGATLSRLRRSLMMLPVTSQMVPDYKFMESYTRDLQSSQLSKYLLNIRERINTTVVAPINDRAWKEYFIEDVFNIFAGKRLVKSEMSAGAIPFIGATEYNNGITNYISNENKSKDRNVLGVNYNGSVVESFYHPYDCIFSDDVKRFHVKGTIGNKYIYLFLKAIIMKQQTKYFYGYKFNEKRMRRQKILLPVNCGGEIDFGYMEHYMKYLEYQNIKKYYDYVSISSV